MKKIIVLILIISSYCFSQTGFLTEKGRSAIGVWGGFSRTIDCLNCNPVYSFSFDYITDFGLEVEVALGKTVFENFLQFGDEYDANTKGVGLAYHLKSNSSKNNVAFGIAKSNTEIDGDLGTADYDTEQFGVAFYNDAGFVFQVQKVRLPDFDTDSEILTFANYFKGQSVSWGLAYSADWDLFDAMIEDGDLEYLKYGTLTVSIGGVF